MDTHVKSLAMIGVYQGNRQAVLDDRALNELVFKEDDSQPVELDAIKSVDETTQELDGSAEVAIMALDIASKKSIQHKQELVAHRTALYAEIEELLELMQSTKDTLVNKRRELGDLQTELPLLRESLIRSMQDRDVVLEPIVEFGNMIKKADITIENIETVNDVIIEFANYLHKIAQSNENETSEFIDCLLPSIAIQYKIHETQKKIAKIEADISSQTEKLDVTQKRLKLVRKERDRLNNEIFRYKKRLERLYRREK